MKTIKIMGILFLLILAISLIGCSKESKIETSKGIVTGINPGKICKYVYPNKSLLLDELFSEDIPCSEEKDCYNFMLRSDDYRTNFPPDFNPRLVCE